MYNSEDESFFTVVIIISGHSAFLNKYYNNSSKQRWGQVTHGQVQASLKS